jgi:hypothetical protein
VAKHYVAISTIQSPAEGRGYLNTGAQLEAVWVNGKQVYRNDGWTGWHAGKERIAVDLPAGASTIVIQSGEAFFLSLTEDDQW